MSQRLPLDKITVIELGHSVAAPFAGQILGDLGAEVIKVEKIDGDDARKWAPPYWGGISSMFSAFNRNKQSVVVDLRDPAKKARLRQLIVDRADVVLQNLRPGATLAAGLDGVSLCGVKPALIYCNISAFGNVGPLTERPGYDPLMQAFAGLMSVTGEPGQNPVRVGTSIIDMAAGMWSVIGILAALLRREATGKGGIVDTSLFETALAWMGHHAANYQASGNLPQREGSGTRQIVPYRGYRTADGFLVVAAGNDNLFARFCDAVEHPEWKQDQRFRTNPDRVDNQSELYRMIEEAMLARSNDQWIGRLEAAGVPCAPTQTIDEVLDHPQTKALGIVQTSPDNSMALVGSPLSIDGQRPSFRLTPPKLGEHTDEVFEALVKASRGANLVDRKHR